MNAVMKRIKNGILEIKQFHLLLVAADSVNVCSKFHKMEKIKLVNVVEFRLRLPYFSSINQMFLYSVWNL